MGNSRRASITTIRALRDRIAIAERLRQVTGSSRLCGLTVFGIALLIRAVHVIELRAFPFTDVLIGDARAYDAWATQIATGDWVGQGVFYQAPLYAYFLAIVYGVVGHDIGAVLFLQAVIGAAACVLMGMTARRLFGATAGFVAGLAMALYAPAVFFDGIIQKSVLDGFLLCLLLSVAMAACTSARVGQWYAVGLSTGLLIASRENTALFVPVFAAWIWFGLRGTVSVRALCMAGLLLGVATLILPIAARNRVVGGEFHLTTAQLGTNLFIGNNPTATGVYAPLLPGRADPRFERQDATDLAEAAMGRSLSPREVSRYWVNRSFAWIRSDPARWLRLEGRKLRLIWNSAELMDTEGWGVHAEWSTLLSLLERVCSFGIIAPLGLLGMISLGRPERPLRLLFSLLGTYVLSILPFYVSGRYRHPLGIIVLLFAAVGIVRGWSYISNGRWPARVALIAALVPFVIMSQWPTGLPNDDRAATYVNYGATLDAAGDLEAAVDAYERAIAAEPLYAMAHVGLGMALSKRGDKERALQELSRALQVDGASNEAQYGLAILLNDLGQYRSATQHYESVLARRSDPAVLSNAAIAEANWGAALLAEERFSEAVERLRRAVRLNPKLPSGHYHLGVALMEQGRFDESIEHLLVATELEPSAEAFYELGNAYRQRFPHRAIDAYRKAIAREPEMVDAHNNLGTALASIGRLPEAAEAFRIALSIDPRNQTARTNLEHTVQP